MTITGHPRFITRRSLLCCGRLHCSNANSVQKSPARFHHFCGNRRLNNYGHKIKTLRWTSITATATESPPVRHKQTPSTSQRGPAEQESLALLEWPALCRQVACFTRTLMGAEIAMAAKLPIGNTKEESEVLLQQTTEAKALGGLTFPLVYDIRAAIVAAEDDGVLHPLVLAAVSSTLATAMSLKETVSRSPALADLATGIEDALPELRHSIDKCIKRDNGLILDEASPRLAEIRSQRKANMSRLQTELNSWAQTLYASGASERAQVVVRRNRLCVPVKSGRQGELPKGSMILATSASGSTMYMEPAGAVQLNNAEAVLAGKEAREEGEILRYLSGLLAQHTTSLRTILACLTALDVASARGRHAAWLDGTCPQFHSQKGQGPVQLVGARHPLLLEPSLPTIYTPNIPSMPAPETVSGPTAGLTVIPELYEETTTGIRGLDGSNDTGNNGKNSQQTKDGVKAPPPPPKPIDIDIPDNVQVVAVTGPNTGGKTASLKTLGLLCLMAKAGLYLPLAQGDASSDVAPVLPWFDRILADVGDGQSLQQSLSTFSGHVRRLKGALAEATPRSLVLLDEVGSGTDPAEGAALAASILTRLAPTTALTYATTHHAELKELASKRQDFLNASAEFDIATLRPTYRLLWGKAGESNALAVARGLSFDNEVVNRAVEVAEALTKSAANPTKSSTALKQSLEEQIIDATVAAKQAGKRRAEVEETLEKVRSELKALQSTNTVPKKDKKQSQKEQSPSEVRTALRKLFAAAKDGSLTKPEAESQLRQLERQSRSGSTIDWSTDEDAADIPAGWSPKAGDKVIVKRMANASGSIVSVNNEKVVVRVGALVVELKPGEFVPDIGPRSGTQKSSEQRDTLSAKLKQQRAVGADSRNKPFSSGVEVQTARNTVDVRGLNADEAVSEIEAALLGAPTGFVLFIVHGIGTGRLRDAAIKLIKRHPSISSFEEVEGSNGGATIVRLK